MATLPLKGGSNFNDIIFREILKKKKKKKLVLEPKTFRPRSLQFCMYNIFWEKYHPSHQGSLKGEQSK